MHKLLTTALVCAMIGFVVCFTLACDMQSTPPENFVETMDVVGSFKGKHIYRYTIEATNISQGFYVLVHASSYENGNLMLRGHYYKSIDAICDIYCQ